MVKNGGIVSVEEPTKSATGVMTPLAFVVSSNATSFQAIGTGSYKVMLGDVSGSMSSRQRIPKLRKSFSEFATPPWAQIAMASWNTMISWCLDRRWLSPAEQPAIASWISQQSANGGNDMKQAIESSLALSPRPSDVYTMCDGDITPFSLESWRAFRAQYPEVRFHFIALGRDSQYSDMVSMASIGGGSFQDLSQE